MIKTLLNNLFCGKIILRSYKKCNLIDNKTSNGVVKDAREKIDISKMELCKYNSEEINSTANNSYSIIVIKDWNLWGGKYGRF